MDIPVNNADYKSVSYWDQRFQQEESYEWLLEFQHVQKLLKKHGVLGATGATAPLRVLVVGCGNSNFSKDLHDAGVQNLVSIDFSAEVIRRMKERQPQLDWRVMDMTDMVGLNAEEFDMVVDKAAMDALVTDEGDPWNPSNSALQSTSRMVSARYNSLVFYQFLTGICGIWYMQMSEVYRVLKPEGKFVQMSFQQPHFRSKYLKQGKVWRNWI